MFRQEVLQFSRARACVRLHSGQHDWSHALLHQPTYLLAFGLCQSLKPLAHSHTHKSAHWFISLSPSHSLINSSAARQVRFYHMFTAGNGVSASPRAPRQAAPKIKFPRPPPAPASPRDAPSQPPPELGEYASGRPRRHTKTPGYRLGSNVEDEHQMVEPEHYRGIPGSGAAEAQPFRIEVTPCAQVCIASPTLPVQPNNALQACCVEKLKSLTCLLPHGHAL